MPEHVRQTNQEGADKQVALPRGLVFLVSVSSLRYSPTSIKLDQIDQFRQAQYQPAMKRFSISKSKTWIAERIGSRSMSKSEEGVEVVSFEADLRDSGRSTEEVMIPQTSKYPGLTALTAAGAGLPGAEIYPVDIISIHGLNGDSFTTWTHKNGRLWLRDFLPADLPGCRVFTYGYPSQIWSHSIAGVRVYAGRLLDLIRDIQDAEREEVCYSSKLLLTHDLN